MPPRGSRSLCENALDRLHHVSKCWFYAARFTSHSPAFEQIPQLWALPSCLYSPQRAVYPCPTSMTPRLSQTGPALPGAATSAALR